MSDDANDAVLDPSDLALVLRIINQAADLPPDHPDCVALRHATSGLYKAVKKRRRRDARERVLANDDAVTAATATGAPGRIDDETAGIPLVSRVKGATAGTLINPRACYVCKERYFVVDAFYHQLCPDCAELHHARRDQRTDLTGRRALLTGGRAKIGMYIALRLLRDGAHTTITTRFPNDAARRFMAMPDHEDWIDRLEIVGIDLRHPAQVVALTDAIIAAGPLDILINNAAQTVRRSSASYALLRQAEAQALPDGKVPPITTLGPTMDQHQPPASGACRGSRQPQVHRERLGDGGPVQSGVQRAGASSHEHGQGGAQHVDTDECPRDVRKRSHPHERG